MRTIEQMVQQEILCCMSSLVSTLAKISGINQSVIDADRDVWELANQAFELASPIPDFELASSIPDYEEAAIQAGAVRDSTTGCWSTSDGTGYATAEMLCNDWNYDAIHCEVFEHWAVSSWLADKLIGQGEKVDTDFAGLNVWARTTTGQQISADGVVERIYAAMMAPERV